KIFDELRWKFTGRDVGRICEALRILRAAIAHEMVSPCDELARRIDSAFKEVESTDAIEVMTQVVFARPQELHRCADRLRNPRRFHHEVIRETPAETATGPHQMNRDVALLHAEGSRNDSPTLGRSLAGGPDLELAVLVMSDAVFRLELSVGNERIR